MSDTPQISVVIPTYNRAGIVPKAIDSVLAQTYPAAEIIVVDDGSKDDTRAVLASYGSRITAISQPNGGLSAARNTGIRAAKTDWVAFLDDDDEYTPDRLAIAVESIARHPDVAVHVTNTAIVNEDGTELDMFVLRGRPTANLMRLDSPLPWVLGGCFFAQTMVARRALLMDVGWFRDTFYEDMDLYVRLAAHRPWAADGRKSLRLRRLPGQDLNLSSHWRSRPVENFEALARIHREALATPGLSTEERKFAEAGLATQLFELGCALHDRGELPRARQCFSEAAGKYPRLHSRIKARLAAWIGVPTMRSLGLIRGPRGVFRSSATAA